jgi:CrcB protein
MELARTAHSADGSYERSRVLTAVAVAVASALGGLGRYGLDGFLSRRAPASFPWGTFAINVSGSFVLGIVFVVMTERFRPEPWVRSAITIGLLGAYTTFSTLSLETYRLAEDGAYGLAVANALGSLAAGFAAVYAGVVIGRTI